FQTIVATRIAEVPWLCSTPSHDELPVILYLLTEEFAVVRRSVPMGVKFHRNEVVRERSHLFRRHELELSAGKELPEIDSDPLRNRTDERMLSLRVPAGCLSEDQT